MVVKGKLLLLLLLLVGEEDVPQVDGLLPRRKGRPHQLLGLLHPSRVQRNKLRARHSLNGNPPPRHVFKLNNKVGLARAAPELPRQLGIGGREGAREGPGERQREIDREIAHRKRLLPQISPGAR